MLRMLSAGLALALLNVVCGMPAFGDGPADNNPAVVRRVPPLGVEVPAPQREQLEASLSQLDALIGKLLLRRDARTPGLLPDVIIFQRAVRDALDHQEFFTEKDFPLAHSLLAAGIARAEALLQGTAPWTTETGLVVRGFVSRLDGSVQPYGLVIPESYKQVGIGRVRCDVWLHGRNENITEQRFLDQRMKQPGRVVPPDTIVLHPFGRYSNAFKFAGEVDVFEALDHVQQNYRIDDDRIAMRGFSMGGAGCWQFAVHYPDLWFAATPGAGFSETEEFLKFFQSESLSPLPHERILWRWYDCPGYAVNLANCPTIAYSGEIDRQKQAADIMEAALEQEGVDLLHLIGPQTAHAIHADSLAEIERRLEQLAKRGREQAPQQVRLATFTLKYNKSHWVTIDRLNEHWQEARVLAEIRGTGRMAQVDVSTQNVTALTLEFPAGAAPFSRTKDVAVWIDEQLLENAGRPLSDGSWRCQLLKTEEGWKLGRPAANGLAKKHDLQGPIDDAFMDSFLFVRPTGEGKHAAVNAWVNAELERAIVHWRQQFRGHVRIKDDTAVTEDDIRQHHLILWGDAASNQVLAKIAHDLPIHWTAQGMAAGKDKFAPEHHALIAISPNPLNPERYVVLNSGFTYREYAYLNNARQVPMLPDWAVIDVRTPAGTQYSGKIAAAGFFDEEWRLPAKGE